MAGHGAGRAGLESDEMNLTFTSQVTSSVRGCKLERKRNQYFGAENPGRHHSQLQDPSKASVTRSSMNVNSRCPSPGVPCAPEGQLAECLKMGSSLYVLICLRLFPVKTCMS